MNQARIMIAGGGAAGFFAAIACAGRNPDAKVTLCELTAQPLAKVRISGGGRCNVTTAFTEPKDLVRYYPRGGRELLGPFHRWGPTETVAWFAARGVGLKAEADGRMFPVSDDSGTIVDCLQRAASEAGVIVRTRCGVRAVRAGFEVELTTGETATCDRLLIATGGGKAGGGLSLAQQLGHTIAEPVPSLFTFQLADARLAGLAGVAAERAEVRVPGTKLMERGPLLITHWGLSGPAILKLSAWGARALHERDYRFDLTVNWVSPRGTDEVLAELIRLRAEHPRRQMGGGNSFGLPQRLWERLASAAGADPAQPWTSVSNEVLKAFARELGEGRFSVTGKSLFKEEFVTCGGVRLEELDFKTMESRRCPGLYFAGEVLDIDGLTGGFNFQSAWTTGWLAGSAMGEAG
jgi:predicted Rossmann fold flavoprotein